MSLQGLSAAGGRDHRGGDADQQDGARLPPRLRPDARPALGHLHGLVRQRRRILPLLLRRRPRLRQGGKSIGNLNGV